MTSIRMGGTRGQRSGIRGLGAGVRISEDLRISDSESCYSSPLSISARVDHCDSTSSIWLSSSGSAASNSAARDGRRSIASARAIAAAVLGGTSLFGGIGNVFPGTVLGALLIQMVWAGLVATRTDLYLQPLIAAGIIFIAVLLDSLRNTVLARCGRHNIRTEE